MLLDFFREKKILITGHTGFKGSWLTAWLVKLKATVVGASVNVPTVPSNFIASDLSNKIEDIRLNVCDHSALESLVNATKPSIIFHLAAQSIVGKSLEDPVETWKTNLLGTLNLLDVLRGYDRDCVVVVITSDKCYANNEWVWGYRENDSLGGHDPYSASKAASELAVASYYKSFFSSEWNKIKIVTARAGNVIGGGDWAHGRIIPDCIRAWASHTPVTLRHPFATRPWQHVLEPISGYLTLAALLGRSDIASGESFNFGPSDSESASVQDVVQLLAHHWGGAEWMDAKTETTVFNESRLLRLNCDKALNQLRWKAVLSLEESLEMTSRWYKDFYTKKDLIPEVGNAQIDRYTELAQSRGLNWAQ